MYSGRREVMGPCTDVAWRRHVASPASHRKIAHHMSFTGIRCIRYAGLAEGIHRTHSGVKELDRRSSQRVPRTRTHETVSDRCLKAVNSPVLSAARD